MAKAVRNIIISEDLEYGNNPPKFKNVTFAHPDWISGTLANGANPHLIENKEFIDCDFVAQYIPNTEFRNCTFIRCRFVDTHGHMTKFIDCTFTKVEFINVSRLASRFSGCAFKKVKMHRNPEHTSLDKCQFHNCRIDKSTFNVNISGWVFTNTTLNTTLLGGPAGIYNCRGKDICIINTYVKYEPDIVGSYLKIPQ